jgi:hypothetical protein
MNRRRPWTVNEEQQLQELRARGASMTLISARLRRSRSAIESRLSLLSSRARLRSNEAVISVLPKYRSADSQPPSRKSQRETEGRNAEFC